MSDPAIEPQAEETPAVEEEWQGVSQDDWQGVSETVEGLRPLLEAWNAQINAPAPEEESSQDRSRFDPFADDPDEGLRAIIREELAPFYERTQAEDESEAEERALDIIQSITQEEGEFLNPEQSTQMARVIAEDFLDEATEKYGFGPRAGEDALKRAVGAVKEYEEAIGKAYHEREQNRMSTLAGARRELPVAGREATSAPNVRRGGTERDLLLDYFPPDTGR